MYLLFILTVFANTIITFTEAYGFHFNPYFNLIGKDTYTQNTTII